MRATKYDEQLKKYTTEEKYTAKDLIDMLGKAEDHIDKINQRSEKLIESMMELLEITKGEKEVLMQKIKDWE